MMSNLPMILIVDDLEAMLFLWKRQMRGTAEVVTAKTLAEGRERFHEREDWALIFLDGQVDGVFFDSLPLLAFFRQTYTGPIVTIAGCPDDRARMMASGCTHALDDKTVPCRLVQLAMEILGI